MLVKCLCLWTHQGNAMWLLVLVDPECGVHGDHTVGEPEPTQEEPPNADAS